MGISAVEQRTSDRSRASGHLRTVTGRDVLAIWGIFLASLIVIIAGVILPLVVDGFPGLLGQLGSAIGFLLCLFGVWWAFLRRGWTGLDLGFRSMGRRGWHLLWQIPLTIGVGLTATAVIAGTLLGLEPAGDSGSVTDAAAEGAGALFVVLAAVLILGPLFEEIMIRRITMGWLDRVLGALLPARWLALTLSTVLSSLAFALLHVVAPVVVWTFFLGLGCALLTRRHRSLWAGFLLHMVVNTLATATLVFAQFG